MAKEDTSELEALASDLATFTEWNLATLEVLLLRKSSSKSDIRRQTGICYKMLMACRLRMSLINWDLRPQDGTSRIAPRAYEALTLKNTLPAYENLEAFFAATVPG